MIEPGEYWRQQLANSLEDSKIILFLATPDSIASRYCQEEILYAKDLGKTIQPISLGSQAELFEVLPRRQWKLKPAAGGAGRCTPLQSLFLKLQVQLHTLDPAPRCASLPFWLVWNGSSQPGVEVLPRRQWKLKPAAGGAGRCTPLQLLFLKLQVQLHALDPAPRCASLPFWLVWNGSSRPCASTWGGGVPAPAVDES